MLQQALAEIPNELAGAAMPVESELSPADAVHAEENILQWMEYLPKDCIKAMINMGWDLST